MALINRRVIWLLLLAVLLLAAFFRFWQLDSMPPGLYHDEAYNGLDALSLTQGKTFPQYYEGWELYAADAHAGRPAQETRFPIFFEGNYGREPLHIYLMALSVALFGATPFAIRAVPAAAGVLAVLTTFLATRALLNGRSSQVRYTLVPLLAAFTVAVLYPAVHFSRFGLRAMVFVPVETLAVACFWWGINRTERKPKQGRDCGTWFLFLLSGLLLGLGLYIFAAARLLPLVWILFVPIWFWRDRVAFGRHWRHIAGMATAALLVSLPLLLFFLRYPYFFIFRLAYVANKGKGAVEGKPWLTWLLNVGRVIRGLFWQGETHLRHNLPGRPYFDLIQAVLFLLGLLQSLRRLLQPRTLFLLLWFVVMLLPSILSGDAPHFGRLSGAAAPAAVLVALGGAWLYEKLAGVWQKRLKGTRGNTIALVLVLLLFVASALWTGRDYFGRYAQHPDLAQDFYLADWQMGLFAAGQSEDTGLYLTPTQEELATIFFALEDPDRLRNYNGAEGLIPAGKPGTETLYMLRPQDQASLKDLQVAFPGGSLGPEQSGFIPFIVPAGAPRNRTENPAEFSFAGQIKLVGWTAEQKGDTLFVTLAWQAEADLDRDYIGFVHLTGPDGRLAAQLDRPPAGYPTSDWQPGEIVLDQYAVRLPGDLPADENIGLSTGFYTFPALEALGETADLGTMNSRE
jgi:4-amino-4-deoxy-L-arabinose transferase-like glycosyltransferase